MLEVFKQLRKTLSLFEILRVDDEDGRMTKNMKVRVFGFICVDSRFIQHIFENDVMTNKERLAIEVPTQIFLRLKNQVKLKVGFPRSERICSFLKHFLGIFKCLPSPKHIRPQV